MTVINRLLRNSFIYAVAGGLQKVTGFLLIPLYTRVLDVESYGVMEILATLTSSALVLTTLGLPSAFNKCYYRDSNSEEDKKVLLGTTITVLIPIAVGVALTGILLSGPIARILLRDQAAGMLAALAVTSTATFALAQIPLMLLRARESSVAYSLLSFCQFIVMMSLNLWLVGGRRLGVQGILISSIAASGAVFLVSIPLLLRHATFSFSPRLARALLAFGLPMVPVAIGSWILNMSDRWMLDVLADRHEVGLYGLGYRFGMLIQVLLVMPFQLAWPAFYFKEAARPDARDLYARVLTWYVVLGGLLTLAVGLLGEIAVRFMAESAFWPGAAVIPLVAAAYFLGGGQYCVAPGVHLGGKTHLLPAISGIGAVSNILMNLLWIPKYGMMGAAFATLCSFAILFALTAYLSYIAYGYKFEAARVGRAVGVLLVIGLPGLLLRPESLGALVAIRVSLLLLATLWAAVWCYRELGGKRPW